MIEFFQTVMGKRYYEHTLPELVRQLTRLNTNLEAIVARMEPAPRTETKQDQG
jgi:hypothetical protein